MKIRKIRNVDFYPMVWILFHYLTFLQAKLLYNLLCLTGEISFTLLLFQVTGRKLNLWVEILISDKQVLYTPVCRTIEYFYRRLLFFLAAKLFYRDWWILLLRYYKRLFFLKSLVSIFFSNALLDTQMPYWKCKL